MLDPKAMEAAVRAGCDEYTEDLREGGEPCTYPDCECVRYEAGVRAAIEAYLAALWHPISEAPFDIVQTTGKPEDADPWLSWCLLARKDEHGWVEWVGGMDGGIWLGREDNRVCWECQPPTYFQYLPAPPAAAEKP